MAYSMSLKHANNRTGLIAMVSIYSLLIITAVAFRFYARRLVSVGFGTDDWLALGGLVFVLALNGIFLGGTIQGAITGHSPVVDNWPVPTELEHLAQKYKYAFQTTEKIAFGLIKLSLLFLWKRIFARARHFVILCWVMIGVISAWFIAFFFATLFQCGTRWDWNWAPISFFLTQCVDTLDMLTCFTATDLFTDFIIMFMPVPLIWKLHMPLRKKIGVTCIFMVGLFTIGAGIARMFVYLVTSYDKENNPDFIADFTLFILWSEIEANVAMIVCCMPTLGPVLGRGRDRLVSLVHSTLSHTWTPLASDRTSTKTSNKDVELYNTTQANSLPPRIVPVSGAAWQGSFGPVTSASYTEGDQLANHSSGIVARTEILRTTEPRMLGTWENEQHETV